MNWVFIKGEANIASTTGHLNANEQSQTLPSSHKFKITDQYKQKRQSCKISERQNKKIQGSH